MIGVILAVLLFQSLAIMWLVSRLSEVAWNTDMIHKTLVILLEKLSEAVEDNRKEDKNDD